MKVHVLPLFLLAFCLILTPCALAQAPQPEVLELVGQIGGASHAVAVVGDYAYLGVGPRLVVLDITDKENPTFVGQSPLLPDIVRGIAVVGNYAFVADGLGGLQIINVSNRERPSLVGSCTEVGDARDVTIDEVSSRAYVAS